MYNSTLFMEWLAKMANVHVLCIGDVMLDIYMYGRVERISPESPIPIVQIEREEYMLGGVGNVARNIVALGGNATIAALRGDDDAGETILTLLEDESRIQDMVHIDLGRSTTVKTRYVAGGQQLLRADHETPSPMSTDIAAKFLIAIKDALVDADVVVVSDYDKGVITDDVISCAVKLARIARKPVLCDPKSTNFSRYSGFDLLTPNQSELSIASRRPVADDSDLVEAARGIVGSCSLGAILVTRGERGMSLIDSDGGVQHLPVKAQEVYDVSGAGDTVMSTMALSLGAGISLGEAASLANVAAGIVVGKVGTSVVFPGEITDALRMSEGIASDTKVCTLSEAIDRIALWRQQGARIGFTNGCFDLLHPGHVSLLEQARVSCDRLVVALNSDKSIHRIKGPGRPVNRDYERASMLASHGAVDIVVIFDEDTPLQMIEAIIPDVLVKGSDYSRDNVVGADFVESNGGKVILAKLRPGYSTTDTLARLSNRGS